MGQVVYFVGHAAEVSHHAAPLAARRKVEIASPESVIERARPGDLAIFYSEHFDRFRQACTRLKQNRVATLYLIDGILEWRNAWENSPSEVACPYTMRPALSDKIACIGNSQARVLEAWGNSGKTEVVGIPRFDLLNSTTRTSVPSSDRGEFRLLVMTAKTPAFTSQQLQTVVRSLRDVKQWAESAPVVDERPVEIVWRLTRDLDQRIGVDSQLNDLTGSELAEVLDQVDAVLTTPSTAMLEAMLRDLPVALLDYHNCPHFVQSGWDVTAKEHLPSALSEMASRLERRMLFQRNQLYDSLYLESPATDRLEQLVDAMLSQAAQQVSNSAESLSFSANLLPIPRQHSAEFSHQRLFPTTEAFRVNDQAVLQAELSHARREIDCLHDEIDQLKSELGQAHQIFETINNHPIAGPIVRIRQKMLDLMATIQRRNQDGKNDESKDSPPVPQPFAESVESQADADVTENSITPSPVEEPI